MDWNRGRSTGQDCAFVKAAEGADRQGPWFSRGLRGARQAGVPHRPCRFYGRTPGAERARNFVATVTEAGYTGKAAGELPPVLYLEQHRGRCPREVQHRRRPRLSRGRHLPAGREAGHLHHEVVRRRLQGRQRLGVRRTRDAAAQVQERFPRTRGGGGRGRAGGSGSTRETGSVASVPSAGRVGLNVFCGSLAGRRRPAHLDGAGGGGTTSPARRPPAGPPTHRSPERWWLSARSRGTDVVTAQHLLNAAGARLDADDIYGPDTTAAVKSFPTVRLLEADGVAGPKTWGSLIISLEEGMKGSAVTALQHQLNASRAPAHQRRPRAGRRSRRQILPEREGPAAGRRRRSQGRGASCSPAAAAAAPTPRPPRVTPSPPGPPRRETARRPAVHNGSHGQAVTEVQHRLTAHGHTLSSFSVATDRVTGWLPATHEAPVPLEEVFYVSTHRRGSLVGRLSCRTRPASRLGRVGHHAHRHP
ncbi:peptidoglycan-binding protein [Streptomyces albogriseolus]|uniref:peptidoglycan-binding protein n=1 Tax=Streptomyces albogriseolus TaxID=1887 RepID=UPI0033A4C26A